MEPYITASRERFRNIRRGHNLSFLIGYEIPWYFSGTTAAEYSQLTVRSPYLDNEFIELLYRAPDEEIDFGAFQLDTISKHDPKLTRIMTNRGLGGGSPLQAVPRRALYKFLLRIDTLFVQAYLPYSLHHRVARLDRFQMSRWVMGFDKFLFYRVWFQKELSGYLKEILLDRRTLERPYWNRGYIEKMVLDHIEGKGNYLLDISKVLTLEMIHRVFIDGSGSS
jgi:asparagine synthase (glutamine-hydrolysing)